MSFNRFAIKSLKVLIIFLLLLFLMCEERPNPPTFLNIFDPNGDFDDVAPLAIFSVSQDSGITNETIFTFDAMQSIEEDSPELSILTKWDFESDSVWDTGWSYEKQVSYVYKQGGGNKKVTLQVQGAKYLTSTTSHNIFVNTRPFAHFYYSQDTLDNNLFTFDASSSSDFEDDNDLFFRWDFNNDNVWEINWTTENSCQYYLESLGDVKLQVKDQNGLSSDFTWSLLTPNNKGLLAYYPFNGNADDLSGNGHHGTIDGAISVPNRFNEPDAAYQFYSNSTKVKIMLGSVSDIVLYGTEFTISMWIKPIEVGMLIHYGSMLELSIRNDRTLYGFRCETGRSTYTYTLESIEMGNWLHLVVVFKNIFWIGQPTFDFYVDGAKLEAYGNSGFFFSDVPITGNLDLGWTYKGCVDELYIYNRVLSEEEISMLYNYHK
jgi:hypothetical protein